MKKNILKATLVAAFALIAGFNVYNSQKSEVISDLALANVEALASGETNGDIYCPFSGYGCIIKYTNHQLIRLHYRFIKFNHSGCQFLSFKILPFYTRFSIISCCRFVFA